MSYNITLDAGEFDQRYQDVLSRALNELGWRYQEELGFIVDLQIDTNPYTLNMTRRIKNSSFEQAYKSLESMITNENMTIFMMADMAFESSQRQDRYVLRAATDISQVVRLSNAMELPPALQESLNDAMETGIGAVIVTLPIGELESSSHQVNIQENQAVMAVPLSFSDQTEFDIAGVINWQRDGTPGGSLEEILREQYFYRDILIIASGAILVVLLIVMFVIKLVRRKG